MSIFGFRFGKGAAPVPATTDDAGALAARVIAAFPGAVLVVTGEGIVDAALGDSAAIFGRDPVGVALHEVLGIGDDGAAGMLQLWLASVVGHEAAMWAIHADQAPAQAAPAATRGPLALEVAPLCRDGLVERAVVFARAAATATAAAAAAATAAPTTAGPSASDVETFRVEAAGLLSDCHAALARLEDDPAARHAVHRLFRSLHTLKGTARTFGLTTIQAAAHEAEELLDAVRRADERVDGDRRAQIHAHLAAIGAMVDALRATAAAAATAPGDERDDLELLADVCAAASSAVEAVADAARGVLVREARRWSLRRLKCVLAEEALAGDADKRRAGARVAAVAEEVRTVALDLRSCPLPKTLAGALDSQLAVLRAARTSGRADEVAVAAAGIAAAAGAFGVGVLARAAERLVRASAADDGGLTSVLAVDEAVDEIEALVQTVRALAPAVRPPPRVDALALAQAEARRSVSSLQRALESWQAQPRGKRTREAVGELAHHAARYRACARIFGFAGLEEQAAAIAPLLEEAHAQARPSRALMARLERWTADAEASLVLYNAYAVEAHALGAAEAELAPLMSALASASPARRDAAAVAFAEAARGHGVLCVAAALAESGSDAERLQRLALDAPRFVAVNGASAAPAARATIESALGPFERSLAASPEATVATAETWPPLRRAIKALDEVPLATIVGRLRRCALDAAQALGRDVELRAACGDVGANAHVVRKLVEMLTHAVRNAVDHGIEPAAARAEANKPPTGLILLVASAQAEAIRVELADDGRGIDLPRVRRRAVERGLLDADAAAHAGDDALCELLFAPGFSTAAAVTELSGRGVGLDVVRELAASIGGRAQLTSRPGQGCRLVIEVPRRLGDRVDGSGDAARRDAGRVDRLA